jgi:tRNA(Ile2) C34 agmatinyltransferase TiaS
MKRRVKIYKKVEVDKEHCNVCETMLEGNGSMGQPYKCKCGWWVWNPEERMYEASDTRPDPRRKNI